MLNATASSVPIVFNENNLAEAPALTRRIPYSRTVASGAVRMPPYSDRPSRCT
jgi:hypothetical protein